MPKIVNVSDLRVCAKSRASPKFSVALLQVDLKQDIFNLLLELLRGICDDHTRSTILLHSAESQAKQQQCPSSSGATSATAATSSVSKALHRIVARLNVLVHLSKRLLCQLVQADAHVYQQCLRAIFIVLRLALWSHNRSVRCAALRCLRYYLHSVTDARLLVETRVDLLIARCFDLSYMPESNVLNQRTGIRPSGNNTGISSPNTAQTPSCASTDTSRQSVEASLPWSRQPFGHHRRSINPRRKMTNTANSQPAYTRQLRFGRENPPYSNNNNIRPNPSLAASGNLPASPLVSTTGERQLFIRLAHHLAQLAPTLFPASLLHALVAPCLRAESIPAASAAGGARAPANQPHPRLMGGRPWHVGLRDRNPAAGLASETMDVSAGSGDSTSHMTNDLALRGCLLIICELLILAPKHIETLTSNYLEADSHLDKKSTNSRLEDYHGIGLVVRALMSTFTAFSSGGSSPSSTSLQTIHPMRIHEAVLLSLLNLVNRADTCLLLPVGQIAKFLVPFTSALECSKPPMSIFDNYPSFAGCAKVCLITMIRSWPGLFYFLHDGLPCLQNLMYSLAVGNLETRKNILSLLFSLFPSIPRPHASLRHMDPAIICLTEALASGAPSTLPVISNSSTSAAHRSSASLACDPISSRKKPATAWDVAEGFIAAEGTRVLASYPHDDSEDDPDSGDVAVSSNGAAMRRTGARIDLVDAYTALLLATLIQAELYESLIRAISDPNDAISVQAGLLFGCLTYKANSLLPCEHPARKRLHNVLNLQPHGPQSDTAVVWLERVHRVMHAHTIQLKTPRLLIQVPLHSPFLECLKRQSPAPVGSEAGCTGPLRTSEPLSKTWMDQLINQSGVLQPLTNTGKLSSPGVNAASVASVIHGRRGPSVASVPLSTQSDPNLWDWDLLASFGRHLVDLRVMLLCEDSTRLLFLERLMDFITPSAEPDDAMAMNGVDSPHINMTNNTVIPNTMTNGATSSQEPITFTLRTPRGSRGSNLLRPRVSPEASVQSSTNCSVKLAWLPHTWLHADAAGVLLSGLVPHLTLYPETSKPGQLFSLFLTNVHKALRLIVEDPSGSSKPDDAISKPKGPRLFDAEQLSVSCSSLLILALGRLTAGYAGDLHLVSSGLCSLFHALVTRYPPTVTTTNATIASLTSTTTSADSSKVSRSIRDHRSLTLLNKVLLSSLDFTRPDCLGRHLLVSAVHGATRPIRLYLIRFIRLLLRLRLPFSDWLVTLVMKLFMNPSPCLFVWQATGQLLEELCGDMTKIHVIASLVLSPEWTIFSEAPASPETLKTTTTTTAAAINPHSSPSPPPHQWLTPFGLRLLDPRSGTCGIRILVCVLARYLSPDNAVASNLRSWGSMGVSTTSPICKREAPLRLSVTSHEPLDRLGVSTAKGETFSLRHLGQSDNGGNVQMVNRAHILLGWLLDMACKYHNLAYTSEVDRHMSTLFTNPGRRKMYNRSNTSNGLPNTEAWFLHYERFIPPHSVSQVNSSSALNMSLDDGGGDAGDGDCDEADDTGNSDDWVRTSNADEMLFDGGDSHNDSSQPPPPLSQWAAEDLTRGYRLPRHMYSYVAEQPGGLDMLIRRGDLETAVSVLETAAETCRNNTCPQVDPTSPQKSSFDSLQSGSGDSVEKTKSALWILAHVGATACGQCWLERHPRLMACIQQLATGADSIGLRVTAWLSLNVLTAQPGGDKLLTTYSTPLPGVTSMVREANVAPIQVRPKTSLAEVVWLVDTTHHNFRIQKPCYPHHRSTEGLSNGHIHDRGTNHAPAMSLGVQPAPFCDADSGISSKFSVNPIPDSMRSNAPVLTTTSNKREVNGLSGMWKAFGKSGSSFSRLVPRRWSPRRKQSANTTTVSPSNSTSGQRRARKSIIESQHGSVSTQHQLEDNLSISAWNAAMLGDVSMATMTTTTATTITTNTTTGGTAANSAESNLTLGTSATWSHRDFMAHRVGIQDINAFSTLRAAQNTVSLTPRTSVWLHRTVCLPTDIRVLGFSTMNRNAQRPTMTKINSSAIFSTTSSARTSKLLSFVNATDNAQSLLERLQPTLENLAISDDTPNPRSDMKLSALHPILRSHYSVSNSSPEAIVSSITSPDKSVPNVDIISGTPHRCLSLTCKRSMSEFCALQTSESEPNECLLPTQSNSVGFRDKWCRQLFNSIVGLLPQVSASKYEHVLTLLVREAHRDQVRRRAVADSPDDNTSESAASSNGPPANAELPLFDACLFAEVARLLATYTFPLQARVKIQSVFLGFELCELYTDACAAVTELETSILHLFSKL